MSDRSGHSSIAWAALLGVDHRSGHYFAENRPDMTALLFGHECARRSWAWGSNAGAGLWSLLGTACLVVGFFFKQTVSIFAAVPLLALFLRSRRPARSRSVLASIPLAVMGGVILGLGFVSPAIHHYMIAVPRAYSINWARAAKFFWELLLDSPLFLVLLAELIVFGERVATRRPAHALAAGGAGGRHSVQRDLVRQGRRLAQQPAAGAPGDDGLLRDAAAAPAQAARERIAIGAQAARTRIVSGGAALDDDLSAPDMGKRPDRAAVALGQGLSRDAGRGRPIAGHCRLP